jgi:hypothetical protein
MEYKMKKQNISVKEEWRQADKEWADVFSQVFYGAPVQELLEKNTKEVTKEVTMNTNRAIVLHLYHTIGLTLAQIAGTVKLTEKEVKSIIEDSE